MKKNVNKAAVAYFAGALIALASDDERFDLRFVDTDLGGSKVDVDRGLESLYVDDDLLRTDKAELEQTWEQAHVALWDAVGDDEGLDRSVEAFNAKHEDRQWEGKGVRPVQRHLIRIARRVLADLYADAQLPAQPAKA